MAMVEAEEVVEVVVEEEVEVEVEVVKVRDGGGGGRAGGARGMKGAADDRNETKLAVT